jgi:hypothetical protein
MVMTALIVMFSSNCFVVKISLQFSEIIGFICLSPVNSTFFVCHGYNMWAFRVSHRWLVAGG